MKTTQGKIFAAYQELTKINKTPGMSFELCKKLFMLRIKMKPHVECQAEQEQVILDAAGKTPDGKVNYTKDVVRELEKIQKSAVEWKDKPVKVEMTPAMFQRIGVTAEMLENLDGFVEFAEVEG